MKKSSKVFHNPVIDLLRLFSSIIVILYHWEFGPSLLRDLGFLGVPFFFVISGYVMTTLYYKAQHNSLGASNFLLQRFSRLTPPHFYCSNCVLYFADFNWFHKRP
jgi:peptidoglycan/LPS O-acetylase OafA/YrhL